MFTAVVEKFPDTGGWHFVRIPPDVLEDLRGMAGKKGNIPIIAMVGNTSWPSTIMSMGEQQWFVALKADVRASENIQLGDSVALCIEPDFSRL